MARQNRQAPSPFLYIRARRPAARSRHEGTRKPKKEGAGKNIAQILSAEIAHWESKHASANIQAAKRLIAAAGSEKPQRLTAGEILEAVHKCEEKTLAHSTKAAYLQALRQILLWLWEFHAAPRYDRLVPHLTPARARNITATHGQLEAIIAAAKPSLQLWIHLCSDMAMRAGTAIKISGAHYDPEQNTIAFVTKGRATQILPVTEQIAAIIKPLDHASPVPYVWQIRANEGDKGRPATQYGPEPLRTAFRKALKEAGVTKRIVPHDLRRTAARNLYLLTKDLRLVQALLGHSDLATTVRYMEQDLAEIHLHQLETIKKPFIAWRKEKSA